MIHPPPAGVDLTADQARQLDDTFLSSDPYSQNCSRIGMMLEWCDGDETATTITSVDDLPQTAHTFANRLGFIAVPIWASSRRERETQIAQDAFTLRQHLAETVVRLAWASVTINSTENACLWATLSTSPNQLSAVLDALEERFSARELHDFATLVLSSDELTHFAPGSDHQRAVSTYAAWFSYATTLLQRTDIALNVVNNKIKHGVAVRARDDIRLDLHIGPISGNSLTVSQANAPALKLFDRPVLEAIHKAPTSPQKAAALEHTLVRVDVPTVLVEAQMLAMLHGAMFHVLAAAHFDSRSDLPEYAKPPAHPGLPTHGPPPPTGSDSPVVGMRSPLTHPKDSSVRRRGTGFSFNESFVGLTVKNGPLSGVVVPDPPHPQVLDRDDESAPDSVIAPE